CFLFVFSLPGSRTSCFLKKPAWMFPLLIHVVRCKKSGGMMRITNMKIGARLGLGFGLILLLVVIMGVVGILRLQSINASTRHMVDESLEKQKAAQSWLLGTSVNAARTLAVVKTTDRTTEDFFQEAMAVQSKKISVIQGKLENELTTDKEKELFAAVAQRRAAYIDTRKVIIEIKESGDIVKANNQI